MKIKLGHKLETTPAPTPVKTLTYPYMNIYDTELPLESAEVGNTMMATVKLKLTGIRVSDNGSSYDFEVHEISFD